MAQKFNCLILGAAGRDFHNFLTFFRRHPQFHVCAFTATQIPFIDARSFPREMAGPEYSEDIPIFPEERLPELIVQFQIDFVFLAYSDLSHVEVMHKASLIQSCGASFALLGPQHTQLASSKPVISITAVRTGAGKSPLTQWLARYLRGTGRRVGVVRHPMPYGDLRRQAVERFSGMDDLDRYACTVEEREEYEPYLEQGMTVFAGVDYQQILELVEAEADVILWDGGNNDFSFFHPGLSIVVADALRPGHEVAYYPGEANFRSADVLVINKIGAARPEDVTLIRQTSASLNPRAEVIEADLEIDADNPGLIRGRRVLVVEDGPTLTHGGMAFGAGMLAARKFAAGQVLDPRPFAAGTIAEAFRRYPHLESVLPALGYAPQQCDELARTIRAAAPEVVIDASPARLDRLLRLEIPMIRVRYSFRQRSGPPLEDAVERFLAAASGDVPGSI
ncbi:MAG: cyclic 2,3-diphosphoglycerate synthase [Deltaproteobacteria bacterium]